MKQSSYSEGQCLAIDLLIINLQTKLSHSTPLTLDPWNYRPSARNLLPLFAPLTTLHLHLSRSFVRSWAADVLDTQKQMWLIRCQDALNNVLVRLSTSIWNPLLTHFQCWLFGGGDCVWSFLLLSKTVNPTSTLTLRLARWEVYRIWTYLSSSLFSYFTQLLPSPVISAKPWML